MKIVSIICMFLFINGCSDADRSKIDSIGSESHVECWSAGVKFYEGDSTGVVHTEEQSDGWYFQEKGTGHFIRISGPCVIRQN